MAQSFYTLLIFSLLIAPPTFSAWARPPGAAKAQYRWERMRVAPVLPSQVFARLGLTHTTRLGFTRDGYTKGTPDPTFPAGLTDVVPDDETHLLLVRGTTQGLAQFRARVLATENEIAAAGRWRVTADLLSPQGGSAPPAGSVPQDVESELPFQVTVGEPGGRQSFQLRVHVNGNAALVVSCQAGLFLPPAGAAAGVLTPAQVWTAPVSRPLALDGTVLFDDLAATRQASRRRLGLPDVADAQDYQLRVSVTSLAPAPPPVTQVPPAPGVAVSPPPIESIPTEDKAPSRP